jgi:DNA invertase Pin-like site-specific DNA recombinase
VIVYGVPGHRDRARHVADDRCAPELERSLIAECTRAGVKAAQQRGVKFGRKPKLSPLQVEHVLQLIAGSRRVQDVAALLSVGRVTLYRVLHRVA